MPPHLFSRSNRLALSSAACCAACVLAAANPARADEVQVRIESLAPTNGNAITPVWVGFHNGSFDTFDTGSAASASLERLAEDGNTGPISTMFGSSGAGSVDGTIVSDSGMIPPLLPGDTATGVFTLDPNSPMSRFFSFASMVIPSNDAFIANGDPMAHRIYADDGTFIGADFIVLGTGVLDAGTEVNDEIPMNTAFFGQMMPNTGEDENGVVHMHPGYIDSIGNPGGTPSILADPMFANADFTAPGYQVAHITVTLVPAPSGAAAFGLLGLGAIRRRRR